MKEFLKNHWKELVIGVLTIVCIALIMSTTCTKSENNKYENNIKAMQDSLKVLTLKNGDLVYEKQAYILDKKELEQYLDISKKQIDELEKKLQSNVQYVTQVDERIVFDTIHMNTKEYINNDSILIESTYNDQWVSVKYSTMHNSDTVYTDLDSLSVYAPLTIGMTEDHQLFATSKNPYLTITSLEGADLNTSSTKKKHWNVGVQAGFGGQYNIIHKTFDVGPYIGVGISYGFDF